jgi:zinc protease
MYHFPKLLERKLDNGLTVLLVPDDEQQGMTMGLQIPVGEFSDPVSFEGPAELTVGLMQKGTASLTPEEFSERLEQTGTELFAETGDEHIIIGCKLLSRHADRIMPVFWEMICSPRFDGRELARLKRELTTALMTETSDPGSLANKHFFPLLCGKEHPAGRAHTIKSVRRIDVAAVRSFYGDYFGPAGSVLVIAGDFSPSSFDDKWSSLCRGWKAAQARPAAACPQPCALARTEIRIVYKKDITQAYLMIGHPVPGELSPDRSALALANYILGGGNFSSRLMERIRSKQGKTYHVGSQLMLNRQCGIFLISTATQSAQTGEVVKTAFDVYREFSESGATEEEIEKAKKFVVGNMAFQLEGIGNIAEKLLWLKFYGREVGYIEHFDDMISSIGRDAINKAIRSYLSSERFAMVVVAPDRSVRPQVAGYGKVTEMHFRAEP